LTKWHTANDAFAGDKGVFLASVRATV